MKASEIKQEIIDNYRLKLPVFIWGSPGIGKSALINQVSDEIKIGLVDLRVSNMDPVDLSGLPAVNKETGLTTWMVPDMLPQVERDGENGFLFLDELTSAPPLMQAGCYRLVQEGIIGDYQLPMGWVCIAAGNLSTDQAVVYKQSSALASRFGHYDMQVDVEEFIDWARLNNFNEELLAFIKYRPNLLHKMDIEDEAHSFPTPRTWEYVNKHMPLLNSNNELNKVSAFVGKSTAIEFNAFMRIFRDLPDIEEIIKSPNTTKVSEDPAVNNATIAMLTKNVTPDNFAALMQYNDRLAPEFQATFTHNAISANEELAFTKAFIMWAKANAPRLKA